MHQVSVILCAYTEARWHDLVAAVASLRCQTLPPTEIIVAVDHNRALAERARAELRGVIVVENSADRGLSGARNSGVAAASGSIIAFLDDDACADADWLAQLLLVFADPAVSGVGGAIEPAWPADRPAWFPREFDWVVGCTYQGMPTEIAPVRNLIGCNMAFRHEVFTQIGGFRIGRVGALSIGQENDETEFCIRLAQQEPRAMLRYQPSARVQHQVSANRTTFSYFVRRCFSEGLSKARLARQVGTQQGLATERDYTLRTLPAGVWRGLRDGSAAGWARALTIIAGVTITTIGYGFGLILALSQRFKRNRQSPRRSPA